MAEKIKEYYKLPGRGLKRKNSFLLWGIRARLWRGKDHLLSTYNFRYAEEYRRFYYKDIQAITIRKTDQNIIWNSTFILLTIIFALLAVGFNEWEQIVFGILAAISIIALVTNILLGTTCITYLQTSVSNVEMPSLGRLKTALKVVKILTPFIHGAQGELDSRDISQKIAEKMKAPGKITGAGKTKVAAALSTYNGKLHQVLFCLFLFDGCLTVVSLFYPNIALSLVSMLFFLATSGVLITALIKQHESFLSKGLKVTTWAALAYIAFTYISSYTFYFVFVAFKKPELLNNQWEIFKYASSLSPFDNSLLMGFYMFSIVSLFLVGSIGLIQLRSFKKHHNFNTGPTYTGPPHLEPPNLELPNAGFKEENNE